VNLIALETSTRLISAALWRDGEITQRSHDHPNAGSELILPWVRELLAESGIALADLDGIAYGSGPGGFTGLRLACGVTQGLAFGANLPVIGIGSLEALALASGEQNIYAGIDARMNEIYTAAYTVTNDEVTEILAPQVSAPDVARLPGDGHWIGCGDGFAAYQAMLSTRLHMSADDMRPAVMPTAAAVARLAAPRFALGEGVAAAHAAPRYVRDKVALTTAERLAQGGRR
jgi:tRNA threonylcarbamoyladenosine biosynthesis protein TsaB